ncbi:MAG: 3-dehydroquinate synthase [Vicingaceae bacterium]
MSQVHHIDSRQEFTRLLSDYLEQGSFSQIFILTDENTALHCQPILCELLEEIKTSFNFLSMPAGEAHKNLKTCQKLWTELTDKKADRQSLLLNLGGGVVTDLGGFVAATYKRGMRFCHLPTSLLGMVDAAIGGKCGVDFQAYKNHLGVFEFAEKTFVFPDFLKTLPEREFSSGTAEMVKHALIAKPDLWHKLKSISADNHQAWTSLITEATGVKQQFVEEDFKEQASRKALNFGHSLGHALESFLLSQGTPIHHGYAVAAGMVMEAFLSKKACGFSQKEFEEVSLFIKKNYPKIQYQKGEIEEILKFLGQDKKIVSGENRFSLLEKIGSCKVGQVVTLEEARKALIYYMQEV